MTKLETMRQKFEAAIKLQFPDTDPVVFKGFTIHGYSVKIIDAMWVGYNIGTRERT